MSATHEEQLYLPHEATIVTGPTTWPITAAQVALFSGIADSDLADHLIASACSYFSQKTSHQICTATFLQTWDEFPCDLRLDWGPVQSVSWIKYYATDGTLTTLSTAAYWSSPNNRPPRLTAADGYSWPETQYRRPEAVQAQYVAGYANYATLDPGILRALYGLISYWGKIQEPVVWAGGVPQDMPHSLNAMLGIFSLKGLR